MQEAFPSFENIVDEIELKILNNNSRNKSKKVKLLISSQPFPNSSKMHYLQGALLCFM